MENKPNQQADGKQLTENNVEISFKKNVDSMVANREYFRGKLESIMKENEDYYLIKGKKSLAKGGAEKLASGFRLQAKFEIDKEAQEIFKETKGLIAYRCKLYDENDKFKGEGGGADMLSRNQNDPNKTIKMAQKRSYVDAIIRTTGLSDIFTQDLEDMPKGNIAPAQPKNHSQGNFEPSRANPSKSISTKQVEFIINLLNDLGYDEKWIEGKWKKKLSDLNSAEASGTISRLKQMKEQMGSDEQKKDDIPTINIDEDTGEVQEAEIL